MRLLSAVSQAIADGKIVDSEFQIILNEYFQYSEMKEKVRAKLTINQSVTPDVEKIKKQAYAEAEIAFQKKLQNLVTASN